MKFSFRSLEILSSLLTGYF